MDCKNCSLSLQTHHNFCPYCGAKVIRKRLTIKALFSHFSEQFLNYDNKFLQTFINLFKEPEAVIGCYISGTRKKYVNVISFFAIAITISGLQLYVLNKYFPELVNLSSITAKGQEELASKNLAFIQEYQSILMILYVPIYAMISKIVFFNLKKYNYTEHLVIFMYITAQLSILSAFLVIIGAIFQFSLGTVSIVTLPLQIFYSAYCLKQLFNLSSQGIILRTLILILVLIVFFILITLSYVAIMYFNGGP
jgi:hypothetical protein